MGRTTKFVKETSNTMLLDMSFSRALELAKAHSKNEHGEEMPYAEIAVKIGKSPETVRRYFTDNNYNPPTWLIPAICEAINNTILIDWLCVNAGGHFIQIAPTDGTAEIQAGIARITREMAEVFEAHGAALADGAYTKAEKIRTANELKDLVEMAESLYLGLTTEICGGEDE